MLDGSLDLADACEHGHLTKVLGILAMGGDANSLMNEEPIFLRVIQKAVQLDQEQGSLSVGDHETSDRINYGRILGALIMFGADVDVQSDKDGLAAVHIASRAGNAKIIGWLDNNKANLNQVSRDEQVEMPPCRPGHVSSSVFLRTICTRKQEIRRRLARICIFFTKARNRILATLSLLAVPKHHKEEETCLKAV